MQQRKRKRKGGLIHYPVLILFSLFFVGMFLLDCVTPDRTVSELENTTLTQRPAVTAQILSSAGLNRFFNDYTQYTKGNGSAPKDPERRGAVGGSWPDV